jgi:hypothetical protein
MGNPIAILFSQSRVVLFCVGVLIGYGAMLIGSGFDSSESQVTDASDITRVELLR